MNDVHVDPSIGRRVDVNLKVGDTASSVTVEAGVNNVHTESSAVGQLVTQEQVRSIQMNGRNPLYLSQMEPGVVRNASMASFAFGLDNGINVSGARSQESIITLGRRADGPHTIERHQRRRGRCGLYLAGADSDDQLPGEVRTRVGRADSHDSEERHESISWSGVRVLPQHGADANTWIRNASSNPLLNRKPPGFWYNQFG